MQRFIAFVVLAGLITGCRNKDAQSAGEPPSQSPAPGSGPQAARDRKDASVAAAPQAPSSQPEQPAPLSREARLAFLAHLRAGRKLSRDARWGEAVSEFEAALAVLPMHGRALSELGWAAFQAGDYDKAREANASAIRVSPNREIKAASLYNLGRVAEATGKRDEAARRYTESLRLRPNDIVARRLSALAPAEAGAEAADHGSKVKECAQTPFSSCSPDFDFESLPCRKPAQTAEETCDCLVKAAPPPEDAEQQAERASSCTLTPVEGRSDLAIASVPTAEEYMGPNESQIFLLFRSEQGWLTLESLRGSLYEGGQWGTSAEYAVVKAETRNVGGVEVLWIEATDQYRDADRGSNTYEAQNHRELVLCPVRGKPITEPHCSFIVPLALVHEYGPIILPEDLSPEERAELAASQAPTEILRDESIFEVRLSDNGKATVVLRKGSYSDADGSVLGEHALW
jgi:tetratricopeptide (TPR) repeat protein